MTRASPGVETGQHLGGRLLEDADVPGVHAVGPRPVHDDLVEAERLRPAQHVPQVLDRGRAEGAGGVHAQVALDVARARGPGRLARRRGGPRSRAGSPTTAARPPPAG